MKRWSVLLLFSLLVVLTAAVLPAVALAQDEQAPSLTLTTEFPRIDGLATGSFSFNVEMIYRGTEPKDFELNAQAPQDWAVAIVPQYETNKRISSISIEPAVTVGKFITLTVTPLPFPIPEPGDYKIKLEVFSGELRQSIDLTARITASYSISAVPANQLYNTRAASGQDNIFALQVTNFGTAPIENIVFSSTNPEGWKVTFAPEKIDLLSPVEPVKVDVNIKPPPKTIAGDYMITLRVNGKQASSEGVEIRVTVKTPAIWGWVGVGVIIIVVAGLALVFMKFGRR